MMPHHKPKQALQIFFPQMSLIDQVVDNFQSATQRRDSKRQSEAHLSEVTEEFKHQKDALELQKQVEKNKQKEKNIFVVF